MVVQLVAKPLAPKQIDCLSERQIQEHYSLYKGYVTRINEIWTLLETADRPKTNPTYSAFRELKVEESYAYSGVKLHELYFENLGKSGTTMSPELSSYICRDFGSIDAWSNDLRATALSARGWAILAYDLDDCRLRNYLSDAHNQLVTWRIIPLVVLDVYEHAYFLDYGTNRAAYLDCIFANLNWDAINARFASITPNAPVGSALPCPVLTRPSI